MESGVTTFLQLLVSGITVGSIYALVAIGFTLVYRASDIFNFAQGEYVMLGGMIAGVLMAVGGFGLASAAAVAIAVTVAIGVASYFLAIKPARDAASVQILIITIGISVLLRGLTSATLGKDFVRIPSFVSRRCLTSAASSSIQPCSLIAGPRSWRWTVAFSQADRARQGRTAVSPIDGGQSGRINPTLIIALCFGISAFIEFWLRPAGDADHDVELRRRQPCWRSRDSRCDARACRAPPALGRRPSDGLLEAFGAGYLSSTYKDVTALAVLLAVLAFRPQGLFGGRSVQRV